MISEVLILLGLLTMVFSLAMVTKPEAYLESLLGMTESQVLLSLVGMAPLVFGLGLLFFDSSYYGHWVFEIHVLGYILIALGLFRLWLTRYWLCILRCFLKWQHALHAMVFLGAIFSAFGFGLLLIGLSYL